MTSHKSALNEIHQQMKRAHRPKYLLMALLLVARIGVASAQQTASLRSADTTIRLAAGDSAPKVVTVATERAVTCFNSIPETLVATAEIDQAEVPLHWTFDRKRSIATSRRVEYAYETTGSPRLRLRWNWVRRQASGPIEHTIVIENLSRKEIWLPHIDSLRVRCPISRSARLEQMFIEKGADTPSAKGTHEIDLSGEYHWEGHSTTYAHTAAGETREIIPWTSIYSKRPNGGGHGGLGWYLGIEFSGRTRIRVDRDAQTLAISAGLDPEPGPSATRLSAGASFTTPTVFVGAYSGDTDEAGNILRTWIAHTLMSPATWKMDGYPLTVNNSWGAGMNVDQKMARRMIDDASSLGLEMFHLDAGWFRGVADWYADPKKFPDGISAIADYAHAHHMKFGLWVDWSQAALDTSAGALNARDPKVRDWLVADLPPDWKPEPFKGQTIDLGYAPAASWASAEVERIIEADHLDMLEHDGYLVAQGCTRTDHPHAPPDPQHLDLRQIGSSTFVESSNSTDVSYHAVLSYYAIYDEVRKHHPGLLLEACNDGGRMVDFGSAAHVDYFSMTDTYDPLSNRRAFYDASHVLPPAMLEAYVERWPVTRPENLIYMLRSGMMGWFTLMLDTTKWTVKEHEMAKQQIALYKSRLRPLIRTAELFHVSARPDGMHWDGMELFDPGAGHGVLFAFRGSTQTESTHLFRLKGLSENRTYQLSWNDAHKTALVSGAQLMSKGVAVSADGPNTSELVFITELHQSRTAQHSNMWSK